MGFLVKVYRQSMRDFLRSDSFIPEIEAGINISVAKGTESHYNRGRIQTEMETQMKYYLAPMEGLTTYNFRRTWHKYYGGMDQYFTPFLANRHMNSRERNDVLPEHNAGMEVVPQILTNRADEFLELAEQLAGYGYKCVNLNLGCPSGTVVARNRGAGFLRIPVELETFLDEIFEKCPLGISIKTRIGVEDVAEWETLLAIYERFPMEELIIHPRLQREGYGGTPHLKAFAEALDRFAFPLCYNGDIVSDAALKEILAVLPGTDTVMIGRGILYNPGLLQELKSGGTQPINYETLHAFHDELLDGYIEIMSGDTNTLYKMKDLWTFLIRSFPDGEKSLKKIRKSKHLTDYQIAVGELFRTVTG